MHDGEPTCPPTPDLPGSLPPGGSPSDQSGVAEAQREAVRPSLSPLASLKEVEARHIADVLDHTHGHIGAAARILGVHRNTLTRKIRAYGLQAHATDLKSRDPTPPPMY